MRAEVFTVDGFYPTGDLGVLDADGYLFFRGRRDDMFKVKGASVYPSEVEAALVAIPEIEKAFVVDVVGTTARTTPSGRSAPSSCSVGAPSAASINSRRRPGRA